jgi:hypothetical protein
MTRLPFEVFVVVRRGADRRVRETIARPHRPEPKALLRTL